MGSDSKLILQKAESIRKSKSIKNVFQLFDLFPLRFAFHHFMVVPSDLAVTVESRRAILSKASGCCTSRRTKRCTKRFSTVSNAGAEGPHALVEVQGVVAGARVSLYGQADVVFPVHRLLPATPNRGSSKWLALIACAYEPGVMLARGYRKISCARWPHSLPVAAVPLFIRGIVCRGSHPECFHFSLVSPRPLAISSLFQTANPMESRSSPGLVPLLCETARFCAEEAVPQRS
jgi:hypothetical protein